MTTATTTPIKIDYPAIRGDLELRVEAGACRLRISPVEGEQWVTGSYADPSGSIDIDTVVDGNQASIKVGRSPADVLGFITGIPALTLQVGKARPMAIRVAAGASENQLELGGLPITRLEVNHGAGSLAIRFSEPLPTRVSRIKFAVGAGKTEAYGLGNVDFDELSVEGGAASCLLDFSGAGLRKGTVRVSTAMASVDARIPATLAAEIVSENLLGHPHADTGFTRHGNAWLNQAAATGAEPKVRIRSSTVMGRLSLTTIA